MDNQTERQTPEADQSDPLPPGPNYGTFGYFRLGILILAIFIAVLFVLNLF